MDYWHPRNLATVEESQERYQVPVTVLQGFPVTWDEIREEHNQSALLDP